MTNENKPPMFGPTAVLDLTTHEPRAGKTSLPFKFVFDSKNNGHTLAFGTTRKGMWFMVTGPSLLSLSAPPQIHACPND